MALSDPSLAALTVFTPDERWTAALLADRTAGDGIRRLVRLGSSVFTRQQVIIRPGVLQLMLTGNRRMFGIDITPDQVRRWVDDLFRVAYAAEAIAPPDAPEVLTSAEELMLRMRRRNPYCELWAILWSSASSSWRKRSSSRWCSGSPGAGGSRVRVSSWLSRAERPQAPPRRSRSG